ncbi:effector-associated constant component EACC1 [Nocardia caishijiensis]|nr:hypothetical protein [Nocardia caishijiensis]
MLSSNPQLTLHTDGNQDDLFLLLDLFRHDDALSGRVDLPTPRTQPDQMGNLFDVLIIAAGAGGVASALVRSLTVWFTHRRSDMCITLQRGDGCSITVDAHRIKAPELLQEIKELIGEPDSSL